MDFIDGLTRFVMVEKGDHTVHPHPHPEQVLKFVSNFCM